MPLKPKRARKQKSKKQNLRGSVEVSNSTVTLLRVLHFCRVGKFNTFQQEKAPSFVPTSKFSLGCKIFSVNCGERVLSTSLCCGVTQTLWRNDVCCPRWLMPSTTCWSSGAKKLPSARMCTSAQVTLLPCWIAIEISMTGMVEAAHLSNQLSSPFFVLRKGISFAEDA